MLKSMSNPFLLIENNFYPKASGLRRTFDQKFANPLKGHSGRFVWDHWHVPEQYSLHRTPAEQYFPAAIFSDFIKKLVTWGQDNLGCVSISPPWLSYYTDGSEQRLHCDNPHGPWAFVYSLSIHHKKKFRGGETIILKPDILSYWSNQKLQQGLEEGDLFWKIAPAFNRLIVFDPRLPHGVNRVTGTRDPREARLVIHGWFMQPQPILKGPIKKSEFDEELANYLAELENLLTEIDAVTGTASLRLKISNSGRVTSVTPLTNTLVSRAYKYEEPRILARWLTAAAKKMQFSRASTNREVILPLIFD